MLGRVPGVTGSRIGHLNGKEIVQADYDPSQTDLSRLVRVLKDHRSFYSVIVRDEQERDRIVRSIGEDDIKIERSDPHFIESKYSLKTQHPDLYYLDLTEQQAVALNSWSYFGGTMPDVLTREQAQLAVQVKAHLGRRSPSDLRPARSGNAREVYRARLLEWLKK